MPAQFQCCCAPAIVTPYYGSSSGSSAPPLVGKDCAGCTAGKLPVNGYTVNIAGMIAVGFPQPDCSLWNNSWVVDQQECGSECFLVSPRIQSALDPDGIIVDMWVQVRASVVFGDLYLIASLMYAVNPANNARVCGPPCDVILNITSWTFRYIQIGNTDCAAASGAVMSTLGASSCGACQPGVGATVTISANP